MKTNDMNKQQDLEIDFDQTILEPMVSENDLLDWLGQDETSDEPTGYIADCQMRHSALVDSIQATA